MAAIELGRRAVQRVWGRKRLPPPFESLSGGDGPIGEIWFEPPEGCPDLLVKYLFTTEPLSIQVHPGAAEAAIRGLDCCKDEAWLVVDAEPGAAIGLGLTRSVDREALRAASVSGEIEQLLNWHPVAPGEILYSPAGTVHAIGGGLSIIEIQQNCDVTYRLYDYGRGRELQLDEAVSAARPEPCLPTARPRDAGDGRVIHVEGGHFVLERWTGPRAVALDDAVTLIPVRDCGEIDGAPLQAGTVWMTNGSATLRLTAGADLLVAYSGSEPRAFPAAWPGHSSARSSASRTR
ncbi:MAG TPA: class I mannose-6-phosphate isomerase [Allosphingosinicella sp.]